MSRHVALCRHGEAVANTQRIVRSVGNDELTAAGRSSAALVAAWALEWAPQELISSAALRAIQTAEIIGDALGMTVRVSEELRDRHYGNYEGATIAAIDADRKALGHTFVDATQDWAGIEEVESDGAVAARVLGYLETAARTDRTLVVTHAGVMVSVLRYLAGGGAPAGIVKVPHGARLVIERRNSRWLLHGLLPLALP